MILRARMVIQVIQAFGHSGHSLGHSLGTASILAWQLCSYKVADYVANVLN